MSTETSTSNAEAPGKGAARIFGPELAVGSGTAAAFAVDGKRPRFVVKAGSTKDIVDAIQSAAAEKLAVIAIGSKSKLGLGGVPTQYDVALDVSRLNRIISYDPGDLTLSVEPGCTVAAVNAALAEHGQFLPLAGPFRDRATIGGTIASGIDSPLRQRYGTARDFVLGVEFVTGDGNLAKSGGRVVKNVTGYDMHKVMIGSLGTLGVLTRINFRTFPLPTDSAALVAEFGSLAGAIELRHRVVNSALSPLTLDIVNMRWIQESGAGWKVVSGFAGTGAVRARYETELREMARGCGAKNAQIVSEERWSEEFAALCDFVPTAIKANPAAVIMKLGVVPQQIEAACKGGVEGAVRSAAGEGGVRWGVVGRGVGVIYFALLPEGEDEKAKAAVVRVTKEIVELAGRLGGHATIPWCPSAWKESLPIWGAPRGDFELMKKVKQIFDPAGVLSPGRFIGGI